MFALPSQEEWQLEDKATHNNKKERSWIFSMKSIYSWQPPH